MQPDNVPKSQRLLMAGLCLGFAIALQIQLSLFRSETYVGLRINAGDILLALSAPFIMLSLWRGKTLLPSWPTSRFLFWPAALAACLALALLNTYLNYGQITSWGLVNKLMGWFILMGLMMVGGWIGTNATEQQLRLMLKGLLLVFVPVALLQATMMIGFSYPPLRQYISPYAEFFYPMAGLMANRNAFGLYLLAAYSFITVYHFSRAPVLPNWATNALYLFLPFLIAYNGSRTVLATFVIMTTVIMISARDQSRKIMMILFCIVAGVVCFKVTPMDAGMAGILYDENRFALVGQVKDLNVDSKELSEKLSYSGDSTRVKIIDQAFSMIKRHPIIGSGLGSVMLEQQKQNGKVLDLIDCSPLWILTEMGVVGLLAFAAFYVIAIRAIFQKMTSDEDEFVRTFRIALLFSILGFSMMCLLHEITYTRHMWFLIGIGLCLPSKMRRDEYTT